MISLHAASRGLISNNIPLGVASDGLLCVSVSPSPVYYGGGGDAWRIKDWKVRYDREILKEDEEILEMLAMIIPTLH